MYPTYKLIIVFQFFPIFQNCFGKSLLQQSLPIIWVESVTTLKSGDIVETLIFEFSSPCLQIEYSSKNVSWCDSELDKNVLLPLLDLCHTTIGQKVDVTADHEVVIGGVFSSTFGISSERKSHSQYAKLLTTFHKLSAQIEQISKAVAALKRGQSISNSSSNNDSSLADTYLEQLNDLSLKVHQEIQSSNSGGNHTHSKNTTIKTTDTGLEVYFALAKINVNTVRQQWSKGILSLKLFQIFTVDLDPGLERLYNTEGVTPLQCHVNVRDKVAFFQVKRARTDLQIKIFEANPFIFYKLDAGKKEGYLLEYRGPREVAYDEGADCIVPYSANQGSVLFYPTADDCLVHNDKSVLKYWTKSCNLLYYLDEHVIQVKQVGDNYAIYCFGFNIFVYKNVYECPQYVFSVHVNEGFKINSSITIDRVVQRLDFQAGSALLSDKVNFHLIPKLAELRMDDFPIGVGCGVNLVLILSIVGGLFGILFIGMGAIVWYLYVKTKDPNNTGVGVTIIRNLTIDSRTPRKKRLNQSERSAEFEESIKKRQSLKNIPHNLVHEMVELFDSGDSSRIDDID